MARNGKKLITYAWTDRWYRLIPDSPEAWN